VKDEEDREDERAPEDHRDDLARVEVHRASSFAAAAIVQFRHLSFVAPGR
jgi:hypothetical protein